MRWLVIVPRTILTLLVGVLATVVLGVAVMIAARTAPRSQFIQWAIRTWSRAWLIPGGSSLSVTGKEHAASGHSYVVVANHRSNLDIMASFLALDPIPIRFLAKKELFKVPILAPAMRSIGIVEVDRQARQTIHEQLNRKARDLVDAGLSLIIYPEATRTRDGRPATFKKGAFTMAVAGGLPVLPMTISGSREAWPPESPWVRGGPISVRIHPPIPTAGMSQPDIGPLRDRVEKIINAALPA